MVVASEDSKFFFFEWEDSKFGAMDTRNCVCPCDLNSFLFFFLKKKHFRWEKGEFHIVLCFRTNSWIRVQEKKKNDGEVKKAVGIPKARKERLRGYKPWWNVRCYCAYYDII
jgi:hypothetical protein